MPDDAGTGTATQGATQAEASSDASNAAGKSFSQSDVDRLISQSKAETQRKWEKKLAELERKLADTKAEAGEQAIAAWREERGLDDDAIEKLTKAPTELEQFKREMVKLKGSLTKAENEAKLERELRAKRETKLRETVTRERVVSVAATFGAIDPQDVWSLTRDRIGHDENYEAVVLDEKGDPTETKLEDYINDLLQKKPHLVKPRGQAGAGSKTAQEGQHLPTQVAGYNLKDKAERERYFRDKSLL